MPVPTQRRRGLAVLSVVLFVATVASSVVALGRERTDAFVAPSPTAAPPDGLGRSLDLNADRTVATLPPRKQATPLVTQPRDPSIKGSVSWVSGAFSGSTLAEHKKFGTWRGRPVKSALYFAPQENWAALTNPSFLVAQYKQDPSVLPVISYAMFPVSEDAGLPASAKAPAFGAKILPRGAAGEFDKYWRDLARNLVDLGLPNAVIRPGWEFNGSWYRWSATGDQGARDFAAYFRNIVTAMRSVPGAQFRFSWCPVQAAGGLDLQKAYPGDDFVDDIAFDVYNTLFKLGASPAEQWQLVKSIKYGLNWQVAFAKAHKKPISFPEWGGFVQPDNVRGSGGDDSSFVRNMFQWMVAHPPAFENYFNYDTDYGVHYGLNTPLSIMPRSAEAYRTYWGS